MGIQSTAGSGGIKSVQRGSVAMVTGSVSVTISAVNMAKAFVTFNNNMFGGSTATPSSAYLANSTTLTIVAPSDENAKTAYWEVVEFY